MARAKSPLFADQPALQSDLWLAGSLIEGWIVDGSVKGRPFEIED